ncbi:MAG: D-glycero-beta-D-manno-heptose 1-phosphate adenylyltransferase [Stigonema ocellatum SAG 48.90 = DSM 106950]|nr:D-glycero-beta-D-manno-heptose 1-phosphate adenylyltransferase [Stigonema ocellatum SAG 48.90 = DSM 106950]
MVIGEAILEVYLEGFSDRLCPETQVPIVTVTNKFYVPGGAANTAVHVRTLGGRVTFLSVIGDDWEGAKLQQALSERDVSTKHIFIQSDRQTLTKQQVMAASQILMRVDSGTTNAIDPHTEQVLIDELERTFPECDAAIISDYGYGILTQRVMDTLAKLQRTYPRILVIDAKNFIASSAEEQLQFLSHPPQPPTPEGTPSPHSPAQKYIPDSNKLVALVASYRNAGRKIVFTNGCFDILHAGHVSYLNRAKALGDVLIIGVNSDDSIRRLKGATRPINPLEDRIQVLSGLGSVDHVIAFEEDTPSNLIRLVCPNVYVKGSDYTKQTLPEAPLVEELGGVVELLPLVENRSTTRIIERINKWS